MSRVLSLGFMGLVVAGLSSVGYGQCGATGSMYGGYAPQYRFYSPSCGMSGGYAQPYYYAPQPYGYGPPSRYQGGGTFGPQGSGSRSYYQQPTYQPAPSYSAPQGSGGRGLMQGSGSR